MSHAPDGVPDEGILEDPNNEFIASVRRLNSMIDQGVSWSGHERNCCFLNTGTQQFANVSAVTGLNFLDDGRGLAVVDWDHDGDLDLWTSNRNAPRVRFMRNNMPVEQHFLALKLVGTNCNRDAIGARVEVVLTDEAATQRIRTLRAGEGFLSQSSKWLHFGLGSSPNIKNVIVRWPGGVAESFKGLTADRHYIILQGSGRAQQWDRPQQPIRLVASKPDVPPQLGPARTLLTNRLPLPPLSYHADNGRETQIDSHRGNHLLLNLWATWCPPCLAELKEFVEREQELRASNVRIIALNVDNLGDRRGNTPAATKALLAKMGFPFETAHATAPLVNQLQLIVNQVYGPNRPLPIPTSLLIDAQGQLAAVYKGSLAVPQLLSDIATLTSTTDAQIQTAFPFEGRWLGRPAKWKLMPLVIDLVNHDFDDEGAQYLRENLDRIQNHPRLPTVRTYLGKKYLQRNDLKTAASQLRLALESDPAHASARLQLAKVLIRQSNQPEAVKQFQRVTELAPDMDEAHLELGRIFLQQKRYDDAAMHFEKYLHLRPGHPDVHMNLGVIYAQRSDWNSAAPHLQEVLRLRPDDSKARNNLGLVFQRQGDDASAVAQFRLAMEDERSRLSAALNLSAIFANSSDTSVRDVTEAVRLAEQCATQTEYKQVNVLDKLATAYAAASRFDDAIQTIQVAIEIAHTLKQTHWKEHLKKQLALYRNSQ